MRRPPRPNTPSVVSACDTWRASPAAEPANRTLWLKSSGAKTWNRLNRSSRVAISKAGSDTGAADDATGAASFARASMRRDDPALSFQLGQRRADRVAGHAQLVGQCANRRQAIPGPKPTAPDIVLNGFRVLPRK